MLEQVTRFFSECARVLNLTRKPSKEEFVVIIKVTGVGIIIIGFIGFLVFIVSQLVKGGL